jgi:peptide deformylase
LNELGEEKSVVASGWYARILQHEIDHLRGALYVDRMRARSFTSVENLGRFWKGKRVGDVLKDLDAE